MSKTTMDIGNTTFIREGDEITIIDDSQNEVTFPIEHLRAFAAQAELHEPVTPGRVRLRRVRRRAALPIPRNPAMINMDEIAPRLQVDGEECVLEQQMANGEWIHVEVIQ
jgi:hypothetical protein